MPTSKMAEKVAPIDDATDRLTNGVFWIILNAGLMAPRARLRLLFRCSKYLVQHDRLHKGMEAAVAHSC